MTVAYLNPAPRPLHFSQLKAMARSPAHYAYGLVAEREETLALRLGAALDALVFGTSEVCGFDGVRRGKEWEAFAAAHAGAICLNRAESERVRGMYDSLQRREDALDLLTGTAQRTINWSIAGRDCEGTPDVFTERRITELKTCRTSDPSRFVWDAIRMGYPAQLAWYTEGLVRCGLARPQGAYIVAVESSAPYPVTVFALTDRAMEQGTRTWRLWFERLRACEESGAWPGYAESTVPFDVPDDDGFTLKIGGEDVEV